MSMSLHANPKKSTNKQTLRNRGNIYPSFSTVVVQILTRTETCADADVNGQNKSCRQPERETTHPQKWFPFPGNSRRAACPLRRPGTGVRHAEN